MEDKGKVSFRRETTTSVHIGTAEWWRTLSGESYFLEKTGPSGRSREGLGTCKTWEGRGTNTSMRGLEGWCVISARGR